MLFSYLEMCLLSNSDPGDKVSLHAGTSYACSRAMFVGKLLESLDGLILNHNFKIYLSVFSITIKHGPAQNRFTQMCY